MWSTFCIRDLDRAKTQFERALDAGRNLGPDEALNRAEIARVLSVVANLQGDRRQADRLAIEAEAVFRELGDSRGLLRVTHDRALNALSEDDDDQARALLVEAVTLARQIRSDREASVVLDLAAVELRQSRHAESARLFVEGLELALARGLRLELLVGLRGLAAAAAVRGELVWAAQILSAADRILAETDWSPEPHEEALVASAMSSVRERGAEPEIAAALAVGREMTDAEAAAFALETVGTA
jgi:hypothetical protein